MNPTPKIAAAGIGGAVATLAVWISAQFGVDMPPEVGAAVATVLSFAAGYLKSDNT